MDPTIEKFVNEMLRIDFWSEYSHGLCIECKDYVISVENVGGECTKCKNYYCYDC